MRESAQCRPLAAARPAELPSERELLRRRLIDRIILREAARRNRPRSYEARC